MSELVLYDGAGVPSPRRVKICLLEKGLPFTIKWMNLGLMDQKAPGYLKLNPTGLVPTLVHEGKAVYESNVINEYLDAVFPNPPLVPKDAYGQARMRMWFAFENDFAKPFRDAVYETMGKQRLQSTGLTPEKLREEISKRTSNEAYIRFATRVLTTPKDDELVAERQLLLMEKMAQMEDQLSDGRTWLCGEQFTLADIALAPRVDMFPVVGVPDLYTRLPNIGKFMERMKARPSWEISGQRPEPGETERVVGRR
ncbi:glutathione S-transferase family protein [Pseudorhodoplanes sp.]|uniref:glutathione S-transferase family protein n=1 Tax=Pseudorhodoplanes sp. TaxID=1934341 RepID=UPI003D0E02B4